MIKWIRTDLKSAIKWMYWMRFAAVTCQGRTLTFTGCEKSTLRGLGMSLFKGLGKLAHLDVSAVGNQVMDPAHLICAPPPKHQLLYKTSVAV